MGVIIHKTIVVTGYDLKKMKPIHDKAIEIFTKYQEKISYKKGLPSLISPLMPGWVNDYISFFIAPDGSKANWPEEEAATAARDEFILWLRGSNNDLHHFCHFMEIAYGPDMDNGAQIIEER